MFGKVKVKGHVRTTKVGKKTVRVTAVKDYYRKKPSSKKGLFGK